MIGSGMFVCVVWPWFVVLPVFGRHRPAQAGKEVGQAPRNRLECSTAARHAIRQADAGGIVLRAAGLVERRGVIDWTVVVD